MRPFIIWLSMIIIGINASQLLAAQVPGDKIDIKAIDTYIVAKMQVLLLRLVYKKTKEIDALAIASEISPLFWLF